ncbi:hypothetical protein CEUSTIGMA_g4144.t1 [Chlamydomonas eustigma]|uniref:Copper homeostasis protein cutC homolog n=1 Tax=Chlamydomonas eustigma TaxID=1157962 RepID=A0A250X0U2_9CHLO|nr:hypothetical protein CEUSTIGMA_g4144.t1 [Chlamydomonas eustigma]|eukprot:GAX76698.1 hypothetical protein CEUSTIGMA_g4144.t1 [Chlamydomonas eustigma]
MVLFELCVDSVKGLEECIEQGVGRIELCSCLTLGGLTPSAGLICCVLDIVQSRIPVHVLIRPRPGDFVYTSDELAVMIRDIRMAAQLGVAGVVIGALMPDGSVDEISTRQLLDVAIEEGLQTVVFHRAFDMCADLKSALKQIMRLGIKRILTSGGCQSAVEGDDVISDLVKQSCGDVIIMAGGGVSPCNVGSILATTRVTEIHGSAQRNINSLVMYRRPGVSLESNATATTPELSQQYQQKAVSIDVVKGILDAIRAHERRTII